MRASALGLATLVMLGVFAPGPAAEQRLWLARDGRSRTVIVAGRDDDFAAGRLQRGLQEASGAKVPIIAGDASPPGDGLAEMLIFVGTAKSNPALATAAAAWQLDLAPSRLTDQGYVARSTRRNGKDQLFLAGGGRDGAIYAVVDLLNWRLRRSGRDVWIDPLDTREVPRFRYRWLWTWDNRMDWGGAGKPVTVMGGGAYTKQPAAFLVDYKRCVDYLADHKFNGLIVWGLLRDAHGGVAAAQELCRYAGRRGVRILPGVGTSAWYGGYYYEGKHPYNMDTWLSEHPELWSRDKKGKPYRAACPSKKANQDWLDRGAEWLFKNFQVGGVNLEMGDLFVCYCDDCRRARAAIPSAEPDYYKDMAISHRVTLATMRRLAPDAWLSYATYTGYTADMMRQPPKFPAMIPEDAICQWTLTGMTRAWDPKVRAMARHNIGYLHWCNSSTRTPEDFYLEEIRSICRNAAAVDFEGLDTYGELSDRQPNAELFYLAWEAFLWDPEMTSDQFVEGRLGRLYGGAAAAARLLEIIPLIGKAKGRAAGERCGRAVRIAEEARQAAAPDGHERWDRLIAVLKRHAGRK